MKRLAFTVLSMAMAVVAAPAFAGDPPSSTAPSSSWCAQHASSWAYAGVGHDVGLFAGADVTADREVVSGYACYDVTFPGAERHGELLNAWWDPEYGSAGAGCIRQAPAALVACKRNAVSLPAEGTTPVTHEDEPWWLHVLDVEVDYRFGGSDIEAAGRTKERCVQDRCAAVETRRATVETDARVTAAGRECRVEGEYSCARTDAGNGVGVGERGASSVGVDDLRVLVSSVCVEVETGHDRQC